MKQVVLAVTLTVDNKLKPSSLAAAIKRVISWVLFNDIEGAEVLAYGTVEDNIQVSEMPAGDPSSEHMLSKLARREVQQVIDQTWATWKDAYVLFVRNEPVSVLGDVGAARHAAREAATDHGRDKVNLVQVRPSVDF